MGLGERKERGVHANKSSWVKKIQGLEKKREKKNRLKNSRGFLGSETKPQRRKNVSSGWLGGKRWAD